VFRDWEVLLCASDNYIWRGGGGLAYLMLVLLNFDHVVCWQQSVGTIFLPTALTFT
jgi:hypothetical protein